MFLQPQGHNPVALIKALEKRVETLENLVKALQSEQRPRIGRPPKGKNEPDQLESGSTGRD
jgi:hypothetical protein